MCQHNGSKNTHINFLKRSEHESIVIQKWGEMKSWKKFKLKKDEIQLRIPKLKKTRKSCPKIFVQIICISNFEKKSMNGNIVKNGEN